MQTDLERRAEDLVRRLLEVASTHRPLKTLAKRLTRIAYECLRDVVDEDRTLRSGREVQSE